jgi:hypothetical protein
MQNILHQSTKPTNTTNTPTKKNAWTKRQSERVRIIRLSTEYRTFIVSECNRQVILASAQTSKIILSKKYSVKRARSRTDAGKKPLNKAAIDRDHESIWTLGSHGGSVS